MLLFIVEDDRGTAKLIQRQSETAGFETACVYTGAEAVEWLSAQTPHMAIFDYTLPDMNAEKLLAALEARDIAIPPFIVATGRGDEQIAVDMMKLGARDYIVKDGIFLEMLPTVVRRVSREVQNERDHRRAEEARLLLERQMQHAQKLESLGVLAGGIAHDFNNLLMVILGNAEMALSSLEPASPVRASVQAIETATYRAASLVKQLLAYAGQSLVALEQVDARALVSEMRSLLRELIPGRIVFSCDLEPDLPTFAADPGQVRQVLTSLITNAAEAIAGIQGAIVLSVGAMYCEREYLESCSEIVRAGSDPLAEGRYVYFEVVDNGCGMDSQTLARVFDPFFSTKFTGRGLGMSAVLGIVRAHNGAIRIDSTPGTGTTFRLLFPVEQPDREKRT